MSRSRYSQFEQAVIDLGMKTGGFPVGKGQLVQMFQESDDYRTFDDLKEAMRQSLMAIYSEELPMDQISGVAHVCAVVGWKYKAGRSLAVSQPVEPTKKRDVDTRQ